MFGCEALKSLTTWASTLSWLGSSPPPRQQNHLIVIGPPGGTVAAVLGDAAADVPADGCAAVDWPADDGAGLAAPPHAATSRPTTVAPTASRPATDRPSDLPNEVVRIMHSSSRRRMPPACRMARAPEQPAADWIGRRPARRSSGSGRPERRSGRAPRESRRT